MLAVSPCAVRGQASGSAADNAGKLVARIESGPTDDRLEAEKEILNRSQHDEAFKEAVVDDLGRLLSLPELDSMALSTATDALGRLGGSKAFKLLADHIDRRTGVAGLSLGHTPAAAALRHAGLPAVPYVLGALRDRDAQKRTVAATVLAEIGDPGVLPDLRSALMAESDATAKSAMQFAVRHIEQKRGHS